MKNRSHLARILWVSSVWLGAQQAGAVIVGGTNGDGTNNAGEATLQAFLTAAGAPAFPYWGNLVRYSSASGLYLGYNPSTMVGWALSADHINEDTTIQVGGHTYNLIDPQSANSDQNGTRIVSGGVNTDLVLYSFSVGGANPIPSLPTVVIATNAPSIGDSLIMAGRGMRLGAGTGSEDTAAPYGWGTPGTSDAVPFRWGSNLVGGIDLTDPAGARYLATDFSVPGTSTSFDGQGALGDSGGGAFILRNGKWVLSGVIYNVADGPDADTVPNPAGYGDITYYTDVYAYRNDIAGITGTLIPEPGPWAMLGLSAGAWVIRRRRSATSSAAIPSLSH